MQRDKQSLSDPAPVVCRNKAGSKNITEIGQCQGHSEAAFPPTIVHRELVVVVIVVVVVRSW